MTSARDTFNLVDRLRKSDLWCRKTAEDFCAIANNKLYVADDMHSVSVFDLTSLVEFVEYTSDEIGQHRDCAIELFDKGKYSVIDHPGSHDEFEFVLVYKKISEYRETYDLQIFHAVNGGKGECHDISLERVELAD